MSTPVGPKLEFLEATETTISVEFKPVSSVSDYELQWKSIEQKWDGAPSTKVTANGGGKKTTAEAYDLQPGTTYCVRLVAIGSGGSKGQPGPELILDTEQVGCTPKKKSACAIL